MRHYDDDSLTLIDRALSGAVGEAFLAKARERLNNDLQHNRFSCARAVEVYTSSIDRAVWAFLGQSPLRRIVYRNHLLSEERSEKGSRFADAFVQETGAVDQHPPRQRWLRLAS
jgi:hypothetical protein